MGAVKVVLTDFERTLARLFEDSKDEQRFLNEVRNDCGGFGVPSRVLKKGGGSPYSLWTNAYRWMKAPGWRRLFWKNDKRDPLRAERMYHAVTRAAMVYELEAAERVRLFDDVQPVLEKLKAGGIPVVIVTNNATTAVKRILERNDAEHLVNHVVGREFKRDMIGKLKPKPNLLMEALKRANHDASTALLVGDSIDDMKAGRAARIRFRVAVLEHSTFSERQLRRAGATLVLNRFGDLQDNEEVQRLLHGGDSSGDG